MCKISHLLNIRNKQEKEERRKESWKESENKEEEEKESFYTRKILPV